MAKRTVARAPIAQRFLFFPFSFLCEESELFSNFAFGTLRAATPPREIQTSFAQSDEIFITFIQSHAYFQ